MKAAICIIICDGHFLTLQRPNGTWCLPGGHIEGDETARECILREVKEESGIELHSVSEFYHPIEESKDIALFYSFADSWKVTLSKEHMNYTWVKLGKTVNLVPQGPITAWVFSFLALERTKPLNNFMFPDAPGLFGAKRKMDIHTGIDLYCELNDEVYAIEDGEVINIENFTGGAESPWWNDTKAILIKGKDSTILYGEILPLVKTGEAVKAGQKIGLVTPVLKKYKGRPCAMLHLELYSNTTASVWWKSEEERPKNLFDPNILIQCSTRDKIQVFDMNSYDGKFSNPYKHIVAIS